MGTATVPQSEGGVMLLSQPVAQLMGRNGMHKYNNQDHSMLTAMLAVKNIFGASYDLWQVNVDKDYHEQIQGAERRSFEEFERLASMQPKVPERVRSYLVKPR